MATTTTLRRFVWDEHLTVDRQAIYLAALFLAVQAGALWVTGELTSAGVDPPTPGGVDGTAGGVEGAAVGGGWVLAEAGFFLAALGAVVVYTRAPEWIQETLQKVLKGGALLFVGAYLAASGTFYVGLAAILGGTVLFRATDHYGVFWAFYNVYGVAFAIGLAGFLGVLLGPTAMTAALVLFAVYDHAFANKRAWMFSVGRVLLKVRVIPVLFIKPAEWRFDWDEMAEGAGADHRTNEQTEPESVLESDGSWGIGTADLMLPAAFAASVLTAGGPWIAIAAVLVGVAVACARLRYEMLAFGSGAGVPALAAGTLGGYYAVAGVLWLGGVVNVV